MSRAKQLLDLPPALDTATTAELYGISADHLWRLAREGRAPVEPLRLGRALRWPRDAVLRTLAIERDDAAPVDEGGVDIETQALTRSGRSREAS
jgi:predicted DNA-binding transcriptional regulator AlpA